MVWIFLVLIVLTILLGYRYGAFAEVFIFFTTITGFAVLIMAIIFLNYSVAQEKISLYEQENEKIEKSVQTFVEEYLDYEREIFSLDVEMVLFSPRN